MNWTPEVIIDFMVSAIIFIGSISIFRAYYRTKIISFLLFGLPWVCFGFYFLIEGLAFLFLNLFLARLYAVLAFPATVFLVLEINYSLKESFNSASLIPIFMLGTLLSYLAFQPEAVRIVVEEGYYTIVWTGLFDIIGILFLVIFCGCYFLWALSIWKSAPFEIKREATIFLFGAFLMDVIVLLIYFFALITIPLLVLFSDIILSIGVLITTFIIIKEPKILFVLPFVPYKLLVKDRTVMILYEYNWSKSNIEDALFSEILADYQKLNEKNTNIVGLVEMKLGNGILMLQKSQLITVGFISSKSSKLLRALMNKFLSEFEKKFKKQLKEPFRILSEFETASELIDKFFSIFPSRIIRDKKQSLLFSKEHYKLPEYLDEELKKIFKEEERYNFIKCEFQRSPASTFSDFLELYKEAQEDNDRSKD